VNTRNVRIIIMALAVMALPACFFGVSRVRYSAPSIDDATATARHVSGVPVDRMFLLKDIAFFVYPRNLKNSGDTMLFPVPGSYKVPQSTAPAFFVGIGLRPNKAGFAIDPAQIQFIGSSMEMVKPTRIIGPGVCNSSSHTSAWKQLPVEPILLPPGVCTSFGIEFPISEPDPSVNFSVQVAGLTEGGVLHIIPTVHFHEQRRLDPFGTP
jgi:hypothetical protein